MALIFLYPLSALEFATFPHVLESSGGPPVPNPILESQPLQKGGATLLTIPILALEPKGQRGLNPLLLQSGCREASEPISIFHTLRSTRVTIQPPLAICEDRELASRNPVSLMAMNLFL